ncbi:unnamed protein product [Diamesa hyperborea]
MDYVFNVCRTCLVPNFNSNYHSVFDNNGKYAKELYFVAGIIFDDTKVNFPALICDGCATYLESCYTFRQQCLKSQKILTIFLDPYQRLPAHVLPPNLSSFFQPNIQPEVNNIPEAEHLKVQNMTDIINDVGLCEEVVTEENHSLVDLTEESVDGVYLESDSGIGGWTPEMIDTNTNQELTPYIESPTMTDCKVTGENHSLLDLTEESVDDVYLESDSEIGGSTSEMIDTNTNQEFVPYIESPNMTDCKATEENHSLLDLTEESVDDVQKMTDIINDVGLCEDVVTEENHSLDDLTEESVDGVYLESDSGSCTPEMIDTNTNVVTQNILMPISETFHAHSHSDNDAQNEQELAPFIEIPSMTDCQSPETSTTENAQVEEHKVFATTLIPSSNKSKSIKLKETAAKWILGRRQTRLFERSYSTPSNFFICSKCNLTCLSVDTLKSHMRWAHSERTVSCEFCVKKFVDKRGLSVHINRTHTKPPKREEENTVPTRSPIGKIFIRRETIDFSRMFPCSYCNKICKSKKKLDKHMEEHPFKCEYCFHKTDYYYKLKAHKRREHADLMV